MPRLDEPALNAACDRLAVRDAPFATVLEAHGYPPLWARPPGFATLVSIIAAQQVSLESAGSVLARLERLAGTLAPGALAALTDDDLRGAGLTRQKARYCRELANRVLDGRTSFRRIGRAGEDDARAMLLEVPGIGPWSADVYLLFAAGKPDIWPRGDVALVRSAAEVFGEPLDEPACAARAEQWRPWRSAAARLLWHAYLSRRGRVHAVVAKPL